MFSLEQLKKAMPKQTFELFVEGTQCYKQIDVASVETIIAMKMDAIINYRTKSRDFYDVYTIAKEKEITLFSMLDKYNTYSKSKTKESELLHRFLVKPLDSDDEGLSEMKPQEKMSFGQLRAWVKEEVKRNGAEETATIDRLLRTPSLMPQYAHLFFGFERMSLLQKFASISEPKMVLEALELVPFEMAYESIAGKNILDYYIDDEKMFESLLFYAYEIPEAWLNSRLYRSKGLMPLILLENSLIGVIKNKSSQERIAKVAMARGVEVDVFIRKMEEKKR